MRRHDHGDRSAIAPHMIADVTLYPTDRGGRNEPLRGGPHGLATALCKVRPDDREAWDCRILLDGAVVAPGESRRLGLLFLTPRVAVPLLAGLDRFYLWEFRIFGEAVPVSPHFATAPPGD